MHHLQFLHSYTTSIETSCVLVAATWELPPTTYIKLYHTHSTATSSIYTSYREWERIHTQVRVLGLYNIKVVIYKHSHTTYNITTSQEYCRDGIRDPRENLRTAVKKQFWIHEVELGRIANTIREYNVPRMHLSRQKPFHGHELQIQCSSCGRSVHSCEKEHESNES